MDLSTKTHGSCNLPNSTSTRPLITFALFAYNQEGYIRGAIEGAFAQDYSPLEIILSDDCSSDKTFDVMRSMVEAYSGNHQIKLRKNTINLGIGGHVRSVAEIAAGEIIVMAAGDDISLQNRVTRHADLYLTQPSTYAVFTDSFKFSAAESPKKAKHWHSNRLSEISRKQILFGGGGVGMGATYSYRKDCFLKPYSYPEFFNSEDRLLPFRASILGKVIYLPESLVYWRRELGSISINPDYVKAPLREDYQEEIEKNLQALYDAALITREEFLMLRSEMKRNRIFWSEIGKIHGRSWRERAVRFFMRMKRNPYNELSRCVFRAFN